MMYRYSLSEVLRDPACYQYAPYEGPSFLTAYRADREALLARLSDTRDEALADVLRGRTPRIFPVRPGERDVATRDVLMDLWENEEDPTASVWMEFLLRRIEAHRRIHARYRSGGKSEGAPARDPELYAWLAAVLARGGRDLHRLNATLKLVDRLASLDLEREPPLTRILVRLATESERRAIQALTQEQGILS